MADKSLGMIGKQMKPESKPAPVKEPPPLPGKAGKLKTRTYHTPTIPTIEKLQDRRKRSR